MTLKLGVIGTGAIGQEHIHRLTHKLSEACVVALNDINKEQAQAIASREGLEAKAYRGYRVLDKRPDFYSR